MKEKKKAAASQQAACRGAPRTKALRLTPSILLSYAYVIISRRSGQPIFKKNIKRCNATPPRAPFSASGEPTGSSSARQGRQCKKMSRHKRLPNAGNQPNPLKGSPRLGFDVNASREPPGPSSARQGRHIQKNEQAQATPQCREYFGGGAASCHCFAMGRTAGFDALKERQHKNST